MRQETIKIGRIVGAHGIRGEVRVQPEELDPAALPAVLVKNHGPFAWGKDAEEAVHNAVVLEEVAMMALHTELLRPDAAPMSQALLDRHFLRKHGPGAYYGQK